MPGVATQRLCGGVTRAGGAVRAQIRGGQLDERLGLRRRRRLREHVDGFVRPAFRQQQPAFGAERLRILRLTRQDT